MAHDAKIITLTVNPALDISTTVDEVVSEHKLRCGASHHEAGGGGVNVAKVVHRLGGQAFGIFTAGGASGSMLTDLVAREVRDRVVIPVQKSTRESFTVTETGTGKEFRFILQGPELAEAEWMATLSALEENVRHGDIVVASGSLPPGVPTDYYARVARITRAAGARCVVDSSGDALREALDEGVFMVKPSLREMQDLVGHPLVSMQDRTAAARALVNSGSAAIVAISLGAEGALVVTSDESVYSPSPEVDVRGTVGAGDSFVAGFVWRIAQGASITHALHTAVAAGAATASRPSTTLCTAELVHTLEAQLRG